MTLDDIVPVEMKGCLSVFYSVAYTPFLLQCVYILFWKVKMQ